jgi:cysteine desulfurase
VEAEALLLLLDREGICASSGSACLADSEEPSHVIQAMKSEMNARETVRFSLNTSNIEKDVKVVLATITHTTASLQG